MFCRTRCLSNPFATDRIIISLFDIDLIPNFPYHGNRGQSRVNFKYTVKLPALESPLFGAKFSTTSCVSRVLIANFVLKFLNFCYCGNEGRSKEKFKDTVKLADLHSSAYQHLFFYNVKVSFTIFVFLRVNNFS